MFINRFLRRLAKRKKVEVIIRSESMVEVLENMLERKLDQTSEFDLGLLEEFTKMNDKLANAPKKMQEAVRLVWLDGINKIKADNIQQKEEVCQE